MNRRKRLKRDIRAHFGEGVSVIVPAVFEDARPLYELLGGVPIAARTLLALNQMPQVREIVLVVREAEIMRMADICRLYAIDRVRKVVCARESGAAAVLVGVYECDADTTHIAIHDPLCPFVTDALLARTLRAAEAHGAAAPAVSVRDTIKIVRDNVICETPERASLQMLQSPLVVESSLLKAALQHAQASGEMSEVQPVLEAFNVSLRLVEGVEENVRIGQVSAIPAAEAILQWR